LQKRTFRPAAQLSPGGAFANSPALQRRERVESRGPVPEGRLKSSAPHPNSRAREDFTNACTTVEERPFRAV
jgi:hypothetical protein